MTTPQDHIEGLAPDALLRHALAPSADDPEAAARAAQEEEQIRAEVGRRLPEFELAELIGRGGMGFVFRARQTRLDREVALKVVAPDAERQSQFAERFAREAQALARLAHPNIVTVHDYGEDGSFCWLVMEYVDGSNLRDVIRAGKLAPVEALALVPKICDALQFAHERGIVHRDIKPENILLDVDGTVKIADFGLAKLIGTPAALVTLTGSHQVLGTFRYMAPEQLDRPLEVDRRADIYSLGVVLYELLTGELPMGRFAPPSERSAASKALDDVVLRALETEPDRRYQHASEVKTDLESVGRGERTASGDVDDDLPAARLSKSAVASVVLFALGQLPPLAAFALFLRVDSFSAAEPSESSVEATVGLAPPMLSFGFLIGITTVAVGLAMLAGGSALGFRAVRSIEREWPRLWGLGAGVIGAWAVLLELADVLVMTAIMVWWDGDPLFPLLSFLALIAGNLAFLAWVRAAVLRRCLER